MTFITIAILVSVYSIFAMFLVVLWTYLKWTRGKQGAVEQLNRLAKSKTALFVQYYSYVAVGAWLILVASLADLLFFHQFSHFGEFSDDPAMTWFGPLQGRSGDIYFLVIILNVITAKASVVIGPLSRMLRQAPVGMTDFGWYEAWSTQRPR